MVPRLAAAGSSFHGASLYYGHDKNALTTARVAWFHTVNLMKCQSLEKAWKVMAYTAKHASCLKRASGQSRTSDTVEKPVVAYSLSWHPDQKPDKAVMLEAAKTSMEKLGLAEHEAVIVAHNDEPQPHVHVIINRIHPVTGMAVNLYRSKRKLQDWAREYQRKEGTMYCPQREENHRKRKEGQKTCYANPALVEAWQSSQDAKSFLQQLKTKGYELAQGRKRLVVVDPHGKALNPTRDLKAALGDSFREQDFRDRLAEIDPTSLPTPEAIKERRTVEEERHKERQRAFEEKAAELIGQQTEKHLNELRSLSQRHHKKIKRKRAELEAYYRLGETERQIATLRHQLENPSLLRKIGFVLLRTDRKLERTIEAKEMQQADGHRRLEEAMGTLENASDHDLRQLEERQAREIEALNKRLDEWRPSGHDRPIRRKDTPEHTQEHDMKRDGPSMWR